MDDERSRRQAATALGRLLSTAEGRHFLTTNGYASGIETVIALPDDTLSDVLERVRDHSPPVVIAIHRPDDQACPEGLALLMVRPATPEGAAPMIEEFGGGGTIGMLWDLMARENRTDLSFRLTEWAGFSAHGFSEGGLLSRR